MKPSEKLQPRKFILRPFRRIPTWYSSYYMSGTSIGRGVVMNLSRSGMRMIGDHSLFPGMEVSVRIMFDTDHPPLEITRASVRWVNQHEFGLRIDQIPPGAANGLAGLISEHVSGHRG